MKKKWYPKFNIGLVIVLLISLIAPVLNYNSAKAETILTVAQAIENNTGKGTVEGYIIGYTNGTNIYTNTPPFKDDTNFAIADSANEKDPKKILPVQIASAFRAEMGLVSKPDNIGKKVQITGSLEKYFTVPGLKSPTAMKFVEDGGTPQPPTKVATVTATIESGAVASGTKISLSTATQNATIHYTEDGSIPTTNSPIYSSEITINEAKTIKAVAVANGLENSEVATFTYTIASLQPIKDVKKLPDGTTAITTGIVTAVLPGGNETVYIQDETDGIVLYGPALGVKVGDKVEATGKLKTYNGLVELELTSKDVKVVGTVEPLQPEVVTPADFDNKKSMLVKLNKITIASVDKGNFTATTEDGTSILIRPTDQTLLTVGKKYDSITGVLGNFNGHQLIPRNAADIVEDSSVIQDVIATPGAGFIKEGGTVTLQTATTGATIHYTTDGTEPTTASPVYSEPIVVTKNVTIKAFAVKAGLPNGAIKTFAYEIQPDNLRIHHIQGEAQNSPLVGQGVTNIEGIVTYVVDASNFYMQDLQPDNNPNTSEGILVFKGSHGVKVGDVVTADGTVKEYVSEGYSERFDTDLTITEIAASTVKKVNSGQTLPKPVVLNPPTETIDSDAFGDFNPTTDGIDYYESVEGMLVSVDKPKIVAPQDYGEIIVVPGSYKTNTAAGGLKLTTTDTNPERITIKMDNKNYVAKTGDYFEGDVTGVMSYGYSNFKLLTAVSNLPKKVEGTTNREVTSIEQAEDKLTVASYNVENFSSNTADAKVTQLAEAIVKNLKKPDVIGLTEMQDNNGETNDGITDASKSFEKLIAKIVALGGPQYSYTDIAPENNQDGGAPGGNIRVGFLYNKDRVELAEGSKGGSKEAVSYANGKLTKNPGRIDPTNEAFSSSRKPLAAQFVFKGKTVVVVANHFNSKGGDQPLFGKNQPPTLKSEIQRHKIAGIVNNFVKTIKNDNPKENVILLGDFNDFEFSQTMNILKGNEMYNMVDKVPFAERYSYTYQGNSQVLDHILVSNNLKDTTSVNIVHINSSFMEAHGRASDHDPVLIQTNLTGKAVEPVEPIVPVKTYNLVGFKTKKLVIDTEKTELNLDETSVITEGIVAKATAIFKGKGLETTTITIDPKTSGTIIDLTGAKVKEVIINSNNVKEIRGAENVQKWTIVDGVDASSIIFTDSKGEALASPPVSPGENRPPFETKKIENITSKVGELVTINLANHFTDPDGDELTFTSTYGAVNGSVLTLPTNEEGNRIVSITVSDGKAQYISTFAFVVAKDQALEPYYQAAVGKVGAELKASLHSIISKQTVLSYDQIWNGIKDTDEDPNNENNVILLYSRKSVSKSSNGGNVGQWNREHVWAKSHGDFGTSKGPGTDLHHLRAEDVTVNSKRGHLDFDEGGTLYNGFDIRYDTDSWEPPNSVKGDVARMLFYMAVRYEGTNGEKDLEMSDTVNTYPKPLHGKLSTLLKWHEQDPVDASETRRNDIIYTKYQHNRNPFIDHPEWVKSIWGNGSSKKLDQAS